MYEYAQLQYAVSWSEAGQFQEVGAAHVTYLHQEFDTPKTYM